MVTAPLTSSSPVARTGRPRDRRLVGALPLVLVLVAVVLAVAGVLAYRHGVAASPFPSAIPDTPDYSVRRFSGPWVVGGTALAGAALTLAIVSIALAFRRRPAPVLTVPDVTDEW